MPNSVTIYGSSDDLIEVEGAIREEFDGYGEHKRYLAFSDGTVLSVQYDDPGCWFIRRVAKGTAEFVHVPHDDDRTTYTDRVTLTGDIRWVVCGLAVAIREVPRDDA